MVDKGAKANFGELLRLQRIALRLTLAQLAAKSQVSPSHLGRIENGKRFPSAHVLNRIAAPLGFDEDELFILAGYLSPAPGGTAEKRPGYTAGRVDPYVAKMLGQEPIEIQHAVIGILTILKSIARGMNKATTGNNSSKN